MKKYMFFAAVFFCTACQTPVEPPKDFEYVVIQTSYFNIASWKKDQNKFAPVKIYIEGDGMAFNSRGKVSSNPTPYGQMIRAIAFGDSSANVAYLARPCQYIKNRNCNKKYWSNARFAPEVIQAEAQAIKSIAKGRNVILIGYSGGAQVAGLVAVKYPQIRVKKIITIAGNLDHKSWMDYHKLPQLDLSLNLADYKKDLAKFEQIHYVGTKDRNIVPILTHNTVADESSICKIEGASHNSGWEEIYPLIWAER